MTLPALRNVDVSPVEHEGETYICLRDPEGLTEDALILTPLAFFIAAHLDGLKDIADIQSAFADHTGGNLLQASDVMKVVEVLDRHGLLLTNTYADLRQRLEADFAAAPVRPAHLAGKSYPAEADPLRAFIDDLFLRHAGTGQRTDGHAADGVPVRGLIVPHIDFERGAAAYAKGYLHLSRQGKPATVFIFGVAHMTPPVPFVLTRKDLATPFGALPNHREWVDLLADACDWDPFQYEIVHRTEHSVEFQAVMLAYLYGPTVQVVPVLCGAFEAPADGNNSGRPYEVAPFLERCRRLAEAPENRVTVIAGADLAHVGRRFGDPFDIDDAVIRAVAARDEEDLAHVVSRDSDGFYQSVMKDHNQRRVCGLNCIYSVLKTLGPQSVPGNLLHYGYAPDPAGGIVSFADVLFA